MKRIVCFLLCIAFVLPLAALGTGAEEEVEFYKVRINAGEGYCVEKAILEEDELYIPAENFARYTHYQFDSETNIFLIKGQELKKAFKYVKIFPEEKQLLVGNQYIDLKNCYMVEGKLYLPLCQMLPILNSMIVYAEERTIHVASEDVTMAHLMYGFDINDYFFDLNKEFYDEEWWLIGYMLPSYLFDSVTDFRLDRLDIFFNSGTFEDYREILSDYLKDDGLFKAALDKTDDVRLILSGITVLNDFSEDIYDMVDWYREMEKLSDQGDAFFSKDDLVEFIGNGSRALPDYEEDIVDVIMGVHKESNGVSYADVFELLEYIYICNTHVEDNHKMLDVVYNLSGSSDCRDVQYRAAKEVYDLYGDNVVLAMTERIGKEGLKELVKKTAAGKKLAVYELTAKAAGAAWELVIPADTGDVSVLTLHAGVADTARMSAVACNMNTEASVEDYRLSLILMMLASRKCYKIMAETAEAYDGLSGDYRAKIEKIENMVQGLYLVAKNQHLDAYENFGTYEKQNREYLKEAGFFRDPELIAPGESIGPEESVYFDFLAQNPVYNYYALVDINQDGCMELLAAEELSPPNCFVDLWIWKGGFVLGQEDIWIKYTIPSFSSNRRWIENQIGGTGGGGTEYFYLDETLTLQSFTVEYYDWSGYLYNGEIMTEEEMEVVWDMMAERGPDNSEEIEFLPMPAASQEEVSAFMDFLAARSWYHYYSLLDIDQDGCLELLAAEHLFPDAHNVYLYLYRDGQVVQGWNNIWGSDPNLYYNPNRRWLESVSQGENSFGVWFYSLDEAGNVEENYFSDFSNSGRWYNGSPVKDEETERAWYALREQYDPESSVEIPFHVIPGREETSEGLYLSFLEEHPEYRYYALLDINQDGSDELLATETGIPDGQKVDLWIYRDGGFVLGWENIEIYHVELKYNSQERWLENTILGGMGDGMEFFYLDSGLNVVRESFEYYVFEGELYNGKPLTEPEDYEAYQRLKNAYDPEKGEDIVFQPVS